MNGINQPGDSEDEKYIENTGTNYIANSYVGVFFRLAATDEVASSGSEVPAAKIVRPISF